ncbi:MAG: hypothetical protein M3M96_01410 [Candidatus Eremiobacteraeota bacterium]|nr:hypothetical protein [Candidatus Eremiobacteraeota bacterium]
MLTLRHLRRTAAVGLLLLVACNGGSPNSQLPLQGTGSLPAASQHRFSPASQAEKHKARPSITSRNVVYCNHGHQNCYRFDLVTSVAIDDNGAFSAVSSFCDDSIWDAPWFFADSTFTLPIAPTTVLPMCTAGKGHGEGDDLMHRNNAGGGSPTPVPTNTPSPTNSPSPTPVPTPTGAPSNLYLVKIDIGWDDLSVAAVAGPATIASGQWTFPKLAKDNAFSDGHLYAFFVASFNGKGCPAPIAAP